MYKRRYMRKQEYLDMVNMLIYSNFCGNGGIWYWGIQKQGYREIDFWRSRITRVDTCGW